MQNVRFLNTSNVQNSNIQFDKTNRIVLHFYYLVLPNMKGVNYEEIDPETFYQLRDEAKSIL